MIPRSGMRSVLLTLSGIIIMLAAMLAPARAQTPLAELQVNAFPGASNLPIWVAQHEGMFARRGIAVTLSSPKSSVEQFKGLAEGRYPVIVTAFDNIIAYHSGRGAAEVGTIPDLVAIMGVDSGLFTLVGSPGIQKIEDLKGRTLAVDALSTGFSFVLKEMLQKADVDASEVSFIAVGNSDNRWKAMQEGRAQAALLALPTDLKAIDAGSKALATVAGSFGHYLGNVVGVRQRWAADHRKEVESFVRGMSDAVTWLTTREHKARAIEILHAEMPALDAGNLGRIYDALMDSRQGLIRNGALDPEAARAVLALQTKYTSSAQPLSDPSAYTDTRYLATGSASK